MRITGVSNNNSYTGLRLKQGADKYLSSMAKKTLLQLDEVGELIKDTEYYHIDIAKEFYISHVNGDRFYPPYNTNLAGKSIVVTARQGINPAKKIIKFDNCSQAENAKEQISKSGTHIGRAGYIVKFLDDQEKKLKLNGHNSVKVLPEDKQDVMVEKLLKKYSV